jgi:hypothetical protein
VQGFFRNEIPPEVALRSILVLHRAAVRAEQFKKFRLTASDLLLNTTVVYIRGLCTSEGLHALDEHIKNRVFVGIAEQNQARIKKSSSTRI